MVGRLDEELDGEADVDLQAVRTLVSAAYGGVLDENPFTLRQATEAARWLYASRVFGQGNLTGALDSDAFTQALEDAVGGIVTYENDGSGVFSDSTFKVVPPRAGMTDNQFANLMDALRDEDLAAAGQVPRTAQGQPVTAATIRRLGTLKSIGDGIYAVTIGGFGLIDEDGAPYVLDLDAVLRAQAR